MAEIPPGRPAITFEPPPLETFTIDKSAQSTACTSTARPYQVIEGVRLGDGRAISVMAHLLPADVAPPSADLLMAPRLIELCFQTAGVLEMAKADVLGLPTAFRSVAGLPSAARGRGPTALRGGGPVRHGGRVRRAGRGRARPRLRGCLGLPHDRVSDSATARRDRPRSRRGDPAGPVAPRRAWTRGAARARCRRVVALRRGARPWLGRLSVEKRRHDWLAGRLNAKALLASLIEERVGRAQRALRPGNRPAFLRRTLRPRRRRSGRRSAGSARARSCPLPSRTSHSHGARRSARRFWLDEGRVPSSVPPVRAAGGRPLVPFPGKADLEWIEPRSDGFVRRTS